MHTRVIEVGKKLAAGERELDAYFRLEKAERVAVLDLIREIAALRGEIRFAHVEAHLAMTALLTAQQVETYDRLRGTNTSRDSSTEPKRRFTMLLKPGQRVVAAVVGRRLYVLVALVICAPPLADSPWAQQDHSELLVFFERKAQFDRDELEALADGDAVVRILDPHHDREAAAVGIIRMNVPVELFLKRYRDLSVLRNRDGMLQIEPVSSPPTLDDFAALQLPEKDLKDLKKSKPGDSEVKLPQEVLSRLRARANSPGSSDTELNAIVREMLLQRVNQYLGEGLGALAPYVDKEPPQSVAVGMKKILDVTPLLRKQAPELHDYLLGFPRSRLEAATDFVYWSVEAFGLKPTVRLKHTITYRPSPDQPTKAVIVEVGLYASHYYVASLSIISWIELDLDGNGAESYLVEFTRNWFDGDLNWFERRTLNGRVKKSLRQTLEEQRD